MMEQAWRCAKHHSQLFAYQTLLGQKYTSYDMQESCGKTPGVITDYSQLHCVGHCERAPSSCVMVTGLVLTSNSLLLPQRHMWLIHARAAHAAASEDAVGSWTPVRRSLNARLTYGSSIQLHGKPADMVPFLKSRQKRFCSLLLRGISRAGHMYCLICRCPGCCFCRARAALSATAAANSVAGTGAGAAATAAAGHCAWAAAFASAVTNGQSCRVAVRSACANDFKLSGKAAHPEVPEHVGLDSIDPGSTASGHAVCPVVRCVVLLLRLRKMSPDGVFLAAPCPMSVCQHRMLQWSETSWHIYVFRMLWATCSCTGSLSWCLSGPFALPTGCHRRLRLAVRMQLQV